MNIAEAIADLGIDRDDDRMILVNPAGGKWAHYTLAECATKKINGDLYLASGLFKPGTVDRYHGRVEGNLDRILWLPFDFDLSDFYGWPKEEFWEMPDAALWPLVEGQQADIEEIFATIGLPIHRLDYTGYGLAVFVYLPDHEAGAVAEIRSLHKQIVERINRVARSPIADAQVSDAGTRIMRLVPCHNTKGAIHRLTKTIYHREGTASEAQLRAAAGDRGTPPTRAIPKTGSVLDQLTTDTLIAAVSPHWTLGVKHELALAISGLLAKAGVPEEQTLAIVEELAASDEKPWDRAKCVHTSYEKVRSGLQVKGFTALQRILPPDLVTWLDGVAQRVFAATHPTITLGGKRPEQEAHSREKAKEIAALNMTEPPPAIGFHGWFGAYRDLVADATEASDALHLGAVLTVAGALVNRRIGAAFGSRSIHPMLYTVLVGVSGWSRKDTAMEFATFELTRTATYGSMIYSRPFGIASDLSSIEGLADRLKDNANQLLYLSELTAIFANMQRQGTRNIADRLIELFDARDTFQIIRAGGRSTVIDSPSVSVLAATQPARLAEAMTYEHMVSGFANRMLFFPGVPKPPVADPPAIDRAALTYAFTEFMRGIAEYPQGTSLPRTQATVDFWNDWYLTMRRGSAGDEHETMRSRHQLLALKLATLYAIGDRARSIELNHIEAAFAVVDWMWINLQIMVRSWGTGIFAQIEERIETVLKQNGAMLRKDLAYTCRNRKWSAKEFGQVFDAMQKNGTLNVSPIGIVQWEE